MKIKELYNQLQMFMECASEEAKNKPLQAYFDFPLQGVNASYDVDKFNVDGKLVMRNPGANRPAGH